MKIYTMTRDYPEAEGQPVELHVPECDITALKARGWTIKEEKKTIEKAVTEDTKEDVVIEPTKEAVEIKTETSFRGRKRNH